MAGAHKFDEVAYYKPEDLLALDYRPPETGWMDTPVDFRPGTWIYPGKPKHLEYLGLANPRQWSPTDEDWKLPKNWKEVVLSGIKRPLATRRQLTHLVLKEVFSYFSKCSECRRSSVFCPYGIDAAEITMMARELLNLIGLNVNWVIHPVSNCFPPGNHH